MGGTAEPGRARHRRRYLLVVLGLVAIAGVLAGVKYLQIASLIEAGKAAAQAGPEPEAVESAVARSEAWEKALSAVGSVAEGVRSVTVSNEAPGIVARIRFRSGEFVRQGQVLVELDASVERAQQASAQARRHLARMNAIRSRRLASTNLVAMSQLDNDEAARRGAENDVEAIRAQVRRKIVRAPFDGRLGIRAVNVGQYLAAGTRVTVIDAVGAAFVDFSLPQDDLPSLRTGMPVHVGIRGGADTVDGNITAIAPTVDASSRNIDLRASVPDDRHRLRPGMFVDVSVVMPERTPVVTVPATAVVHAAYGDSVFVIGDKKAGTPGMSTTRDGKPVKIARQQFVRLGATRGDFMAITAGLTAGQPVVSAGAFKLRNGSPVVVDPKARLKPELAPRPENR